MKTPHTRILAGAAIAGVSSMISIAGASVITGVSIDSVSSQLGGAFDRAAIHIIDGSGFDEANGFHTNAPDAGGGGSDPGSMWLTNGVFSAPNDPLPAFVVIDLGASYNLNSIRVWNYNETRLAALTGRGANSVDISIAGTIGGPFVSLGNFTFTQATGSETTDFSQTIDVSALAAADNSRLVRFDIQSNHGGDNEFAGLSEVRFDGAVVPESSALGLLGCAAAGLWVRRRRLA